MGKNQQSDHHCDINRMLPKITHARLNHMLDWLDAVMLWCSNAIPRDCRVRPTSFTAVNNLLRQTGFSMLASYLHLIFVISIMRGFFWEWHQRNYIKIPVYINNNFMINILGWWGSSTRNKEVVRMQVASTTLSIKHNRSGKKERIWTKDVVD